MSMLTGVEEKKVEEKEEPKDGAFCCKQCPKVFSNGKALGGHTSSAHVQPEKDRKLRQELDNSPGSGMGIEKFTCKCCRKGFGSSKAVDGHMSKHKNKTDKGMTTSKSELAIYDGLDGTDVGNGQFSSLGMCKLTANDPRLLSNATTGPVLPVHTGLVDASTSTITFTCEECGYKCSSHQAFGGHMSSHHKPKRVFIENTCDEVKNTEGQKKAQQGTETHSCDVCSRSFDTPRAFKLHKRSHVVPNQTSSSDTLSCTTISSQDVVPACDLKGLNAHGCDVCNQSFCTSDTLEIHKKTHVVPDHHASSDDTLSAAPIMFLVSPGIRDSCTASSSQGVVPAADENVQNARRGLDIDLNKEPPVEDS